MISLIFKLQFFTAVKNDNYFISFVDILSSSLGDLINKIPKI
jgi:hypothetical protein